VLSAVFSPFHPNLVIGGTYSGQILIWDTRAKQLPVLKTPLGAAGHTHPVYNIQVVGTQNANHLITASTDGLVCTWMLDMLAQPQESLELLNSNQPKTDEVAITCLDFPVQETTQFWVGTEEGNIYLASRFDRAGSKAGLQLGEVYKGHAAPITGIDFHKASALQGSADFSDLFLSSSMDWTAKLWRIKSSISSSNGGASGRSVSSSLPSGTSTRLGLNSSSVSSSSSEIVPLLSFEETSDYVMDVKWHRASPSLFALADASGQVHIYNLLRDSERPLVSTSLSSQGLNKLSFDRATAGKHLAVGGADGRVHVLEIGSVVGSVFGSVEKDAQEMQRLLSATARSSGAGSGTGPAPVTGRVMNGAVGL
jgi:dynein intermediate chain